TVNAPSTRGARLPHRPRLARAAHIGLGSPLARPAQIGPDHSQADIGGPGLQRGVAGCAHAPTVAILLPDRAGRTSPAPRFGAACINPDPLIVCPIAAVCQLARPGADIRLDPWCCRRLRRAALVLGGKRLRVRWAEAVSARPA